MSEEQQPREPTDLRRFQRGTEIRLAVAVVIFLTVIGNALVWMLFGRETAVTSMVCSLGGVLLFGGLYLLLTFLSSWSERVWRG